MQNQAYILISWRKLSLFTKPSKPLNICRAFGISAFVLLLVVSAQGQEIRFKRGLSVGSSPPPVALSSADSQRIATKPYGTRLFGKSAFSRNILGDMKFVARTGLSDVAWVYSSPARFHPRTLKFLAGIVALGAGIYFLDDEISAGLQRNKDHWSIEPFHEAGEFLEPVGRQGTMNKYILGTAVVSYLVGFEWLSRMSSEILESYLIAGPPKVIVNKITGRPRPIEGYRSNHWDFFEPGQSFFSGHASHAFQIARIADEHIHFVPMDVVLYMGAASVAVQRVDSRWHWASDVWVGGAYGFAVADALVGRHRMKWMTVRPFSGGPDDPAGLWLSIRL